MFKASNLHQHGEHSLQILLLLSYRYSAILSVCYPMFSYLPMPGALVNWMLSLQWVPQYSDESITISNGWVACGLAPHGCQSRGPPGSNASIQTTRLLPLFASLSVQIFCKIWWMYLKIQFLLQKCRPLTLAKPCSCLLEPPHLCLSCFSFSIPSRWFLPFLLQVSMV